MKSILGSPVRRGDYFEREVETENLWWQVDRSSVLMLAPRRVGKTSLLYHLHDHPRNGWRCLFCSVEPATSESEFVARLLIRVLKLDPRGAAWAKLGEAARKLLETLGAGRVRVGSFELTQHIGDRWQEVGETLIRLMAQLEGKSLLLIDEFPIFISQLLQQPSGGQRAQIFMNWFRDLRNDPDLPYGSVRFILTGSIGLDAVLKQAKMTSTINDLVPFSLGPLSPELAEEFLDRLAKGEGVPLSTELRARICFRLSWLIPFYIQLYYRLLAQQVLFHRRELSLSLADEIYEHLLSSEMRPHFEHWLERLHHPLTTPEERDLQMAILEAATRDARGVNVDSIRQLRRKLAPDLNEGASLLSLERDGYLTHKEGRWRFSSSLLRDWWSRWVLKQPE